MKFLCLAYLDRGLAPPPGVAADYGALGEAMRAGGVFIDSGQLSPSNASKLVRVTGGQAESLSSARPSTTTLTLRTRRRPPLRASCSTTSPGGPLSCSRPAGTTRCHRRRCVM